MADEQETTKTPKKDTQSTSTTKTNIPKDDVPSNAGGVGGNGISTENTSTRDNNGEIVVKDPLINIGCRFQNGIIINLPTRPSLRLQYGFTKLNKSIWEMIVASGQYDELIKEKTIYLSKNGR